MPNESTFFAGGRGHRIISLGAQPSVGNLFSIQLNDTHFHRLLSMRFLFTADANVADRILAVSAYDGTNPYHYTPATPIAVANSATNYHFEIGSSNAHLSAATDAATASLSPDLIILPDHYLRIYIQDNEGGDQLSDIVYVLEDYLAI